jgi:hypothetical protein
MSVEKHGIITSMHCKARRKEKIETSSGRRNYPGILKMSLNSIPGGSIGSMTNPSVPNA